MPGARSLGRALAAAYRSAGGPEQQVAVLRDTLAATSAAEAAARAERRDPDAARLAREVCQVRAWLLIRRRHWARAPGFQDVQGRWCVIQPSIALLLHVAESHSTDGEVCGSSWGGPHMAAGPWYGFISCRLEGHLPKDGVWIQHMPKCHSNMETRIIWVG